MDSKLDEGVLNNTLSTHTDFAQTLKGAGKKEPTLRTERLILRPFVWEDAGDIFDYASRPEVSKYTTFKTHTSLDDAYFFLREIVLFEYLKDDIGPLAIEYQGKVIGSLELRHVTLPLSEHIREFGCVLNSTYWGMHFMEEAAHALFEYAFAQPGIEKILARYVSNNKAVCHLSKILGFQVDGIERAARFLDGEFIPMTQASILREEYNTVLK